MADTSAWYVDTSDLIELDVVKVNAGQKVSDIADALPGVTMADLWEAKLFYTQIELHCAG